MELRMKLDGKLVEVVKVSASNCRDGRYMEDLKDGLRLKHHGLIVKMQKEPLFYFNIPAGL